MVYPAVQVSPTQHLPAAGSAGFLALTLWCQLSHNCADMDTCISLVAGGCRSLLLLASNMLMALC